MLEKLRSIDKKILIGVAVVFLAIIGVFIYLLTNKITNVERIMVTDTSESIAPFLNEVIANKEEDGCYITFAIDYLYANTGRNQFSVDEVLEVINKYFDINFTRDDVTKIGLTSYMMNKGIKFDMSVGGFSYEYKRTRTDIAVTPLTSYQVSKVKKVNKNQFVVYFNKFVVDDPYKLLNIYTNADPVDQDAVDNITKYVKGEIIPAKIFGYINENNINLIGKDEGKTKVTFVVKDNKLKIKKIG